MGVVGGCFLRLGLKYWRFLLANFVYLSVVIFILHFFIKFLLHCAVAVASFGAIYRIMYFAKN